MGDEVKPVNYHARKLAAYESIAESLKTLCRRRRSKGRLGTEKVEEKLAEEYGF